MFFLTVLSISSKKYIFLTCINILSLRLYHPITYLIMKTTTSNPTGSVSKMYCTVFGHQYDVSKKVTKHVKEYTCKCCKNQLTTNSNGDLTELTPTFKEINSLLERIYVHRTMILNKQKTLAA